MSIEHDASYSAPIRYGEPEVNYAGVYYTPDPIISSPIGLPLIDGLPQLEATPVRSSNSRFLITRDGSVAVRIGKGLYTTKI